jgi:hypothetical protein
MGAGALPHVCRESALNQFLLHREVNVQVELTSSAYLAGFLGLRKKTAL